MPTLILGPIIFQGFEIPTKIPFGGKHKVAEHFLMGGQREIHALGPDPDPIKWDGIFQGGDAVGRARRVDALRISGRQVIVAWLGLAYPVIVKHFQAETERFYQVPYQIELHRVDSEGGGAIGSTLGSLILQDLNIANLLTS